MGAINWSTLVPTECTHGDLRLTGGESKSEGRVEVCYKGGWYSVCGIGDEEASVMCKQLGHTEYPCKLRRTKPSLNLSKLV